MYDDYFTHVCIHIATAYHSVLPSLSIEDSSSEDSPASSELSSSSVGLYKYGSIVWDSSSTSEELLVAWLANGDDEWQRLRTLLESTFSLSSDTDRPGGLCYQVVFIVGTCSHVLEQQRTTFLSASVLLCCMVKWYCVPLVTSHICSTQTWKEL